MPAVLLELLPLILGGVFPLVPVTLVLLMLASPSGLAKGGAFVVGTTLIRLVQGLVFGAILVDSPEVQALKGGQSPIVAVLLLVVGILLLLTAIHT